MANSKSTLNQAMADAVLQGLSSPVKTLPSWLFYDEEGDRIFQQIMRMAEYYPTRCEYDIIQQYKSDLLSAFRADAKSFHLIELGAGDGLKTEILLQHMSESGADFTYCPVDISSNALTSLTERLTSRMPELRINPLHKSYDEALTSLRNTDEKKVILFMGANIGNFTLGEAVHFLRRLAVPMRRNDLMLIGFDLKKDPRIILEAYDDPHGYTAAFNLNLLARLNRDLGANFEIGNFTHYPSYDPVTGAMKSFLVSLTNHEVHFEALEKTFQFHEWEPLQTEVSQKYDVAMIEKMMSITGLKIERFFSDPDHYFSDVLVRRD